MLHDVTVNSAKTDKASEINVAVFADQRQSKPQSEFGEHSNFVSSLLGRVQAEIKLDRFVKRF